MPTRAVSTSPDAIPVFPRCSKIPLAPKETRETRVHLDRVVERAHSTDAISVLFFVAGPQQGMACLLDGEQTIGRDGGADIVVADESVSRRHARVVRHHEGYFVEDLESRNGTYINGQRVMGRKRLRVGEYVRFGSVSLAKLKSVDDLEFGALSALHESAHRDPLTGLYNRRHFDECLRNEFSFTQRHGQPLALVLLDIDHFKRINDEHSHLAGDFVLRVVAASLQRLTRPEDVCARYGGEEFAVLARGTTLRNAEILAERMRARIDHLKPMWVDTGEELSVTVSAGVTAMERGLGHGTAEEMLQVADIALYDAKARGRNRIATLPPSRSMRPPSPTLSESGQPEAVEHPRM